MFDRFENFTSSVLRSSTKKGADTPEHEFFDLCDELLICAQNLKLQYDQRVIFLKIKYIKYVNSELKRRKEKKSQLYFDDLLLKVYDAVAEENDNAVSDKTTLTNVISKTYKAALIDEFQDTDSIQYRIFSSLFSKSIMFLIGDPKQSIYSFRGADIFTYLEASGNVTSRYSLDTNYRCQKELLDATNVLFGLHENMFVFNGISFSESKAAQVNKNQEVNTCAPNPKPFQFLFFDTEEKKMTSQEIREHICSLTASEISTLLNGSNGSGRKFQPQDIAVLVRKNSEAEIIKTALTEAGIHSVIDSGNSVFGTPEAVEFLRLLNAIYDPYSYEACFCALTTDFFGYNGNEIYALNNDSKKLEQVTELFFKLHDLWTESGFEVMSRYFFNRQKIRSKVLSLQSGERKLTNYLHLSELIHVEEIQKNLAIPDILSWITDKIHGDLSHVPDEEVVRLESDEKAVKIVTIHKSKGLEYKVVFCPFCWHRSEIKGRKSEPIVFHNENNETVLALGSSEIENNKNLAEKEILAENMRLLYVALTRAKSECYVVFGKFPGSETSPLSYLLFGDNLESFMVQSLKVKVKALSESEIFNQIKSLEHKCSSICVRKVSVSSIGKIQNAISNETVISKQLECRQFSGIIPGTWRISSFSSLSRTHHDSELPDYDYNDIPQEPQNDTINFNNIMDFPKGALAGTFLHHVFEHVQFSDLSNAGDIISEALSMYGFDPKWFDTVLKLVHDVTEAVLNNDSGLKLSEVTQENCIKEVQFDFPIKQFSVSELDTALTANTQPDLFGTEYSVSGLDFFSVRGYMKGFIDLVFKSNGKFFILDWKSNHLGSSSDNYTPEKLFEVMKKEHYILQSYIYLTALNKFLKLRFPQYDYDTHFGGIYYLFLRGIASDSQTGIYFSHPPKTLPERLEKVLCQPPKRKTDTEK
ncbi:MAG: exodeoxyribonuclease V subunit beta, partial [Fibrobacter sp.]|nr:exodeoxyribonuclease V subunit beta [Fibrobacter sp.]